MVKSTREFRVISRFGRLVLSCNILLVILCGCSKCGEQKIKNVFEIPKDIDSCSLLNFGFKSQYEQEAPFLESRVISKLYFYKKTSNYEAMVSLKNQNSKNIQAERIDVNKDLLIKLKGPNVLNFKKINFNGINYELERQKEFENWVTLHRMVK